MSKDQAPMKAVWRSPDLGRVVSTDELPCWSNGFSLLRRPGLFPREVLQAFDLLSLTPAQLRRCVLLSQQRGHGWCVSTARVRKEGRRLQRLLKTIKADIAVASASAGAPRRPKSTRIRHRSNNNHNSSSSNNNNSSSSSSSKRKAAGPQTGKQGATKRAKAAVDPAATPSAASGTAVESGSPCAHALVQPAEAPAAAGGGGGTSTAQRRLAFGEESLHSRAEAALGTRPVVFASNVEVTGALWEEQLRVLQEHIPSGLHPKGAATMLAHTGDVLGVNTVQMFVKTKGCTTSGHQENNNFVSVNINLGPGTCVWYGVRACHLQAMKRLCQEKGVEFCDGRHGWWPDVQDLRDAGIDFECFEQQPNEAVLVMPGALHWVRALGTCANVSWNLAPYCALQFVCGFHSTRPLVSMSHLARKILKSPELPSDCGLVGAMIDALCSDVAEAERFWEGDGMAALPAEEAHLVCVHCRGDLGHVFFSTSPEHVYCIRCRDKLVQAVWAQLGLADDEEEEEKKEKETPTRAEIDAALPECFVRKEDPEHLFHTFFYFQDQQQMQEVVQRAMAHYRCLARSARGGFGGSAEPSHRAVARTWCRETSIEAVASRLWEGPHTDWAAGCVEQRGKREQEDNGGEGEAGEQEEAEVKRGDGDADRGGKKHDNNEDGGHAGEGAGVGSAQAQTEHGDHGEGQQAEGKEGCGLCLRGEER